MEVKHKSLVSKINPIHLSEIEAFFLLEAKKQEKDLYVDGFSAIAHANASAISFWTESKLPKQYHHIDFGLLLVPLDFIPSSHKIRAWIHCENPYHAMVQFLEHFYISKRKYAAPKIASTAKIHPTAVVEGEVKGHATIGPHCFVAPGSVIGERCVLEANNTVYSDVEIGENTVLQAGAVLGSRGFGFYENQGKSYKVPHCAGVRIGKNCEIGANSVIASGFLSPTFIGDHCHFDSFVQIAHNCWLSDHIFMASQSGLGGSTIVGSGVKIAGGAQVAGHLSIGKNAIIAAKAGVTKNIASHAMVAGFPAIEIKKWRKQMIALRNLGASL